MKLNELLERLEKDKEISRLQKEFKEQLVDYILENPELFKDIINSLAIGQQQQWDDWVNDRTDYHNDDFDYHLANFDFLEFGLTNQVLYTVVNYDNELCNIISPLINDDNYFISELIVRGKDLIKGQ